MVNKFVVRGSGSVDAELARLIGDTTQVFDLNRLRITRAPIQVGNTDLRAGTWPHRINQCLVKGRNSRRVELGPYFSKSLREHIDRCIHICEAVGIDWTSPYLYVTVDTAAVVPGSTQRVPGWHFDDLQGTDIHPKRPGGFLFVSVSCLPTEFAVQPFDPTGLDLGVHNIFEACARQIDPRCVIPLEEDALALISAYDVHRGVPCPAEVTADLPRVFVRLLFSHCPLTSRKTTLNPSIDYDHTPHVTSGAIPSHLV